MAKKFKHAFGGETPANVARDYENAAQYGNVGVGADYLYFDGLMQVEFVPMNELVWAYMRQEDSRVTLCCGKGILETCYLIIRTARGDKRKVHVERKDDLKKALALLEKNAPSVVIGYSKDNALRFEAV
ncbi:MAG: hypothetical protein LBS18_08105 [Clostridiales bacterium]|nr:hypothetical protein [Clostridiales bacterium]